MSFCGGCGQTDPEKRCIGCLAEFEQDFAVIVCEPCGRAADVLDEDLAEKAGWGQCWDGWVCPECRKEDTTHGE